MSSLKKKLECAEWFARRVVERLGDRVYKVVLFGSVAKGVAGEESDVDVHVVVSGPLEEARRELAEIAFEAGLEFNESVEYITMSLEEYKSRGLDNPLMYEVEKYGKVLYSNPGVEEEASRKLLKLADEYYNYALKCREMLMYRAAIDLGQNAVELLLKALIIASGHPLPRTHGGYVHKFGEIYVVAGGVPRDLVAKLYRALELRNKTRYDPDYEPTSLDVEEVLGVYSELRGLARKLVE
ncbi:MAG: HEPN domain-containing protein [Desulfurococcaceae archaeon]